MESGWDFLYLSLLLWVTTAALFCPLTGPWKRQRQMCAVKRIYLYSQRVCMSLYAHPCAQALSHSHTQCGKVGTDVCMSHLSPITSPRSVPPYGLLGSVPSLSVSRYLSPPFSLFLSLSCLYSTLKLLRSSCHPYMHPGSN